MMLRVFGCLLAMALLGCGGGESPEQPASATYDGNQAPELATRVASGTLPPLQERLPEEPFVVQAVEEVGQYGGDWRQLWRIYDGLDHRAYRAVQVSCFTALCEQPDQHVGIK